MSINRFLTYNTCVKLKDKQIDSLVFAKYYYDGKTVVYFSLGERDMEENDRHPMYKTPESIVCNAYTHQQVMNWLRDKFDLHVKAERVDGGYLPIIKLGKYQKWVGQTNTNYYHALNICINKALEFLY